MADTVDLKHMVMSFRVSELQVLLGFAGRNKSGRKQELLTRTLNLLSKGSATPVQIKIRELYRRRFPGKMALSPRTKMSMPSGVRDGSSYGVSSMPPPSSGASNVPIHPDVHLKNLPFYDHLAELLKPSSLVARGSSRFQESAFVFHLTPQQAQDVVLSRDIDYNVQIQMRFCLLETSCAQEDNFPPSICVNINNKMATLPNPIPTNKPGVEPKRPSRPVNITSICRISPTVPNHVNVSWASELGRSYCVAVNLVKKLSSDKLLSRLKNSGHRHPDFTRALIKDKLKPDPDSEIATTSLRVSLNCPLGKMRMSVPCRATTCNHLQCFDAPMYLLMNEKKPTWVCPVCDKPAEFGKLVIDGLFREILKTGSSSDEIEFFDDGTWKCKSGEKSGEKSGKSEMAMESPSSKAHVIQMIEDSPMPTRLTSSAIISAKVAPPPKIDVACIDLTESDLSDDDDLPTVASSSVTSVVSASSPSSDSSNKRRSPMSPISSSDTDDGTIIRPLRKREKLNRPGPPPDPVHSVDDDSLDGVDLASYDLYNLLTANGDMNGQFDFLKPGYDRDWRHRNANEPPLPALPTLTMPQDCPPSSHGSDSFQNKSYTSSSQSIQDFLLRPERTAPGSSSEPLFPDVNITIGESAYSHLSSILADGCSSTNSRASSSPDIIPLD